MTHKEIMEKARKLYAEAMELREQYAGNDIPQAEAEKIGNLLDQVENLRDQADQAKRFDALNSEFEQAAEDISFGGQKANDALEAIYVSNDIKVLAQAAGFPESEIKVSPMDLERNDYDPNRDVKVRIATLLLWKYGEKNMHKFLTSKAGRQVLELKDLATQPGGAGGYAVADTMLRKLVELQAATIAMRQISQVLPPIPGGSVIAPSEEAELSDPEWTSEVGTGSDDVVEPFGQRLLAPKPLAKRIKVSRTLLRAATLIDVEGFVLSRLNRKFSEAEENAFINGTGANQPFGLLLAGITAVETAASNTLAADDIINWAYTLPDAYAGAAKILANRSFIRKTRLLKGTDNNYLWQPGLAAGSPPTILDWPYVTSDKYPTGLTADAYDDNALVATIGDFSYYWIVDSLNFEVQRLEELYAATNQVGFIGRKETDGMVVAVDAFRNLKIKA